MRKTSYLLTVLALVFVGISWFAYKHHNTIFSISFDVLAAFCAAVALFGLFLKNDD